MADALHAPDEILKAAEPPLVLCPLGFERRVFRRFGKLPVITTGPGADAIRRAFAERDRWPVREPRLIVLLGLAGGLRSTVRAGQSATIASVVDCDGTPLFRAPTVDSGPAVVESRSMLTTPADKRALAERSHADLVDMESRTFAQCAREARLPWAIVRGVGDDADTALPAAFAGFVDDAGETRVARVVATLLRRPALLAETLRIGAASHAAMRHASFEADALGCLDGIDLSSAETPLLLFGGSFDPPHVRHATVLAEAMRALRASAALVVPAAINPLKSDTPPADPDARVAMCRANFADGEARFPAEVRLSRMEIDRGGPSYTIDTIVEVLARRPRLRGAIRFLVGSDAILGIERWHRWRELLAIATPAVVVRPPASSDSVRRFLAEFAEKTGVPEAPSWMLEIPPVELASTDIRAAIARGERPSGLSDGVWREIAERRLYGFGAGR